MLEASRPGHKFGQITLADEVTTCCDELDSDFVSTPTMAILEDQLKSPSISRTTVRGHDPEGTIISWCPPKLTRTERAHAASQSAPSQAVTMPAAIGTERIVIAVIGGVVSPQAGFTRLAVRP